MEVPADALYGASTRRAVLNFPISGQPLPRRFIRALALIKQAAAEANAELGLLADDVAAAIAAAAAEVADGRHDAQFPIDVYQTGSGTSTNTNMNEVVATLATRRPGRRPAGPPQRRRQQVPELERHDPDGAPAVGGDRDRGGAAAGARALRAALEAKADELWPVVKTGRTHLQDATPIRLGQEFRGYAGQVEESIRRARAARDELLVVPLGGTAVGTGINAHPEYAAAGVRPAVRPDRPRRPRDRRTTSTPRHRSTPRSPPTARSGRSPCRSGRSRSDVRLMGMGPRAGLAEIALPETQPGSSIMPGKVNPVIVESLTMVVARVVGNDATVGVRPDRLVPRAERDAAGDRGGAARVDRAAGGRRRATSPTAASAGITATDRGPALVEQGLMLATALAPEIGYDAAAALAKEAFKIGPDDPGAGHGARASPRTGSTSCSTRRR